MMINDLINDLINSPNHDIMINLANCDFNIDDENECIALCTELRMNIIRACTESDADSQTIADYANALLRFDNLITEMMIS